MTKFGTKGLAKIKSVSHRFFRYLIKTAINNTEESFYTIKVGGTLGVILFPIFYVIWEYILPEPYESLWIRVINTMLCVFLVFHEKWPKRFKRFLPLYWHASVLIILPFFQTYMLLQNDFSITWIAAQPTCFYIVVILFVDWVIITIMYVIGILGAWFFYWFLTGDLSFFPKYVDYLPLYGFAIVMGFILNYKQKESTSLNQRLQAMFSTSTNIAHELRTPLATIRNSVNGINRFLPKLVEGYKTAEELQKVSPPLIDAVKIRQLQEAMTNIVKEVEYSNEVISMLLVNSNVEIIQKQNFSILNIQHSIEVALDRYPFKKNQRELIHIDGEDFYYAGFEVLVSQIIQNLLRNALYYVAKAGKGEIYITTKKGESHNFLYFKDTGEGIRSDQVKRIFNRFYTTRFEGTGIGLSFCKEAMQRMNGEISCNSEYGSYTEFVLSFPVSSSPAL